MKKIYFLLIVLFLIQSFTIAQQNKNLMDKVLTRSEDILKANIESHNTKKVSDTERTIVTTRILDNGYVLVSQMGQFWNGTDWDNSSLASFTYTPEGLKTEETNQYWNNGGWENSTRFLTTYYFNDLVSLYEELSWNGTGWENSFQYESFYNSDNRITEYNVYLWNGSGWDNMYKTIYTYYSSGNLETITDLYWDVTGWINSYKYSYQYNTNNDVSERLTEEWNQNIWKNSINDLYSYNSQNQLELNASFWWADSIWKESVEIYYEYDSFGNITDMLTKFWESEILGMQNKYHTINEYLPATSLKTIGENQEWNLQLMQWENTWRDIYNYNGENILENYLMDVWDGNNWISWSQDNYTYDENGNLDTLTAKNWDGSQWINSYRAFHSWSLVTSVENGHPLLSLGYSLEQNYPNPFNPNTVISYQLPVTGIVTLKVFDFLGNEIATLVNEEKPEGEYEVEFNGAGLTSGVYFYKLQVYAPERTGSFVVTKKMMLIK